MRTSKTSASAFTFLLLAGCGGAASTLQPSATVLSVVEAPAGGNGNRVVQAIDGPVTVAWSPPASTPGCFFFSGPLDLGRDDALGDHARLRDDGRDMTLAFDTGALFAGPSRVDPVALGRRSTHSYQGSWIVEESLVLERVDAETYRGVYHYDELGPGAETPGECHIDAGLVIVRSP